ncbi:ribosome hibernation-promoting factor, HPF/YfiA family [Helicovermis profundi]|uniref:Ribosome hibernation promoting factor n=1 Tax=Helicovermis profundi TaxID=3065157 RepID=A0AAU9EKZ1_9FIRM|nr:ribosome-associated translation inhibitor RaiA [Clostridia bacterium S502]
MKVNVTGRNLSLSEAIKNHVESKLEKFDKFFRSDIEAQVTLSHSKRKNKNVQVIEIYIPLKNDAAIRVQEESEDMYASVDMAIDKLNKQIVKHKTKLEKRYRGHDTIRFEQIPTSKEEQVLEIVKTKKFPVKPMDPEEAVLQMELLGHAFFVFRNGDTEEINVVYARKDGKYGLIEPGF